MPWANPNYSVADSRDFVRRSFAWRKRGTAFGLGIFDPQTRELLGSNGLHNITRASRSAEIGYWVRSDRAGKGIATESSALMLRFAFETLHRHRVILRAATDNQASNRVAVKLGFHLDGTQRHADRLPRGWIDLNFYSLLEDEYARNRDQILAWIAPKND
jgi:ribosomal-protein-serine acetyltransferase